MVRFFVNGMLRPIAVNRYMPAFVGFAPWYTVISIAVFVSWRLYGGLWKYAGVNEMNRIILANICTSATHIIGTHFFFTRMPITYHIIGTLLQFALVVMIRFSYRALLAERRRLRSRRLRKMPVLVVGSGEIGRRVIKNLEGTDYCCPAAVIGYEKGSIDGIPIYPLSDFERIMDEKEIGVVFIADPLLKEEERKRIKQKCGNKVELHDFTGFYSNLGGKLSLTELFSVIHSPIKISINGQETEYSSGEEALGELKDRFTVKMLEGDNIVIDLEHEKTSSAQEALAQAYAAIIGDESFSGEAQQ